VNLTKQIIDLKKDKEAKQLKTVETQYAATAKTILTHDRQRRWHSGRSIPLRYRFGMSIQIAVRLPEEAVEFVDAQVSSGAARSRADFIWHAIKREQRRLVAARDAAIYAAMSVDDDEFAGLEGYAVHVHLDELD
jgi:Arc/MetJ-type ribon-helix-helix transcriptional regulator